MTTQATTTRIMAVDPGMRYLGVVIMEGEKLIWYGIKTFPGRKTVPEMRPEVQRYLADLLQLYQPQVLAVEEPYYAQSLLNANLRKLTEHLKTWGRWKGLQVHSYVPPAVQAFFCRERKTKQSLAEAMIQQYPFLARYFTVLPWRRRYWFHVFDAVGLALMCSRKLARSKVSR